MLVKIEIFMDLLVAILDFGHEKFVWNPKQIIP